MQKLPLAFSCLLLSQIAAASVVVSVSPTEPSENVEASYTGGSPSGYQWRDNENSRRDLGQSFLAESSFVMESISFRAWGNIQNGASGADFDIAVYESSDKTLMGSEISTSSGAFLTTASNTINGDWITFTFDEVSVTAGNYYTVILSWESAGVTDQDQVLGMVSGNPYDDGYAWESTDGTNFNRLGGDLQFSVQSQIPEPSSAGFLIGLTGALLVLPLRVLRRRR